MSLRPYRRPRIVVLNANAPVFEAARAIESNNIGAVVVQDQGRAAGIVTDRDLTLRVLGQRLDPERTLLRDVMTTPILTLSPVDSQADAIRLMRQRNIRRIPLVENDRFVGIVTLDDLLLDEAASLEELAVVVQSQLGEGGPASASSPSMLRRNARAEATYRRLLNELRQEAAIEYDTEAETALDAVVTALVRRLTPGEAKDLISQLPSLLQARLQGLPPGPNKLITRELIETELVDRLGVNRTRAAEILMAVGATIADNVSPGQMRDVQGQLPEAMRSIFSKARRAAP